MIPTDIIRKYYSERSELYKILLEHSFAVANYALELAQIHPEMHLDKNFIYEAAMLHDIGIFKTNAPDIHCFGDYPYICHGYLGSELMTQEGFSMHALVCERHTGSGITLKKILKDDLPLPHREMLPVSLEEKIICFADKFYSKTNLNKVKTVDKVRKKMEKHGRGSLERFDEMCKLFLG